MWIITDRGFFSAVQHRDDHSLLMIRARAEEDVRALAALTDGDGKLVWSEAPEVVFKTNSDYAWRITVSKLEFTKAMAFMVNDIDYDNFKNSVTKKQGGARHDLYMKVWGVLMALQTSKGKYGGGGSRGKHDDHPMALAPYSPGSHKTAAASAASHIKGQQKLKSFGYGEKPGEDDAQVTAE